MDPIGIEPSFAVKGAVLVGKKMGINEIGVPDDNVSASSAWRGEPFF